VTLSYDEKDGFDAQDLAKLKGFLPEDVKSLTIRVDDENATDCVARIPFIFDRISHENTNIRIVIEHYGWVVPGFHVEAFTKAFTKLSRAFQAHVRWNVTVELTIINLDFVNVVAGPLAPLSTWKLNLNVTCYNSDRSMPLQHWTKLKAKWRDIHVTFQYVPPEVMYSFAGAQSYKIDYEPRNKQKVDPWLANDGKGIVHELIQASFRTIRSLTLSEECANLRELPPDLFRAPLLTTVEMPLCKEDLFRLMDGCPSLVEIKCCTPLLYLRLTDQEQKRLEDRFHTHPELEKVFHSGTERSFDNWKNLLDTDEKTEEEIRIAKYMRRTLTSGMSVVLAFERANRNHAFCHSILSMANPYILALVGTYRTVPAVWLNRFLDTRFAKEVIGLPVTEKVVVDMADDGHGAWQTRKGKRKHTR